MNNVLLQGGGEPAGTFLPDWMTGYAFLFPTAADLQRARQARERSSRRRRRGRWATMRPIRWRESSRRESH